MSYHFSLEPITLTSSNYTSFINLGVAFFSLGGGCTLLFLGMWPGWILCGLSIPLFLYYTYCPVSTLMVTFGGISVTQLGRTSSFTWDDVEGFSIAKPHSKKLVVLQLSRSALLRGIENNVYLSHITDAQGVVRYVIPDNYGYSAEQLQNYLRHWRENWKH